MISIYHKKNGIESRGDKLAIGKAIIPMLFLGIFTSVLLSCEAGNKKDSDPSNLNSSTASTPLPLSKDAIIDEIFNRRSAIVNAAITLEQISQNPVSEPYKSPNLPVNSALRLADKAQQQQQPSQASNKATNRYTNNKPILVPKYSRHYVDYFNFVDKQTSWPENMREKKLQKSETELPGDYIWSFTTRLSNADPVLKDANVSYIRVCNRPVGDDERIEQQNRIQGKIKNFEVISYIHVIFEGQSSESTQIEAEAGCDMEQNRLCLNQQVISKCKTLDYRSTGTGQEIKSITVGNSFGMINKFSIEMKNGDNFNLGENNYTETETHVGSFRGLFGFFTIDSSIRTMITHLGFFADSSKDYTVTKSRSPGTSLAPTVIPSVVSVPDITSTRDNNERLNNFWAVIDNLMPNLGTLQDNVGYLNDPNCELRAQGLSCDSYQAYRNAQWNFGNLYSLAYGLQNFTSVDGIQMGEYSDAFYSTLDDARNFTDTNIPAPSISLSWTNQSTGRYNQTISAIRMIGGPTHPFTILTVIPTRQSNSN